MARVVMSAAGRRTVRGAVFDMDGTLTEAVLDFAAIKRDLGIPPRADILTEVNSWATAKKHEAFQTIDEHERDARRRMELQPGCLSLCEWLDRLGMPRGLVTRNTLEGVEHLHHQHFFPAALPPFEPALSREFTPYKPDPAALLHIAGVWGVHPSELVMIGDSAKDDVVSGNRAGALTILLDQEGRYTEEELVGEMEPDFRVRTLAEVRTLLEREIDLVARSPSRRLSSRPGEGGSSAAPPL